jgi:hypothetical protein
MRPAHFRASERVGARKRRSCRCTKLPASACLDVPEFENCIHEGACFHALLGCPAEFARLTAVDAEGAGLWGWGYDGMAEGLHGLCPSCGAHATHHGV